MGRYYSTLLYLAHTLHLPVNDIVKEAFDYHNKNNQRRLSFPRFELYMAEALILTGHYEEGLHYVHFATKNYTAEHENTGWRKFLQAFYLLQAIAFYKTGNLPGAAELYERINPADFYFLRKKFSNILYLLLTEKLKRQHVKHSQQLSQLLLETGYQRLRAII
jgi:hypothetical protein